MMRYSHIIAFAIVVISIAGCVKKPDPVTSVDNTGKLVISIENMAGNQLMKLNGGWYKNENGDSLQFTTFNYFISNIKLIRDDGTSFAETESYHLIKESDASSKSFIISSIPPGNYKAISFLIGVDSARNVSGAQTGALDQNSGMFWDWNTGYIMAKMEALSPQAQDGNIVYHLGGYSGEYNMLRTITLNAKLNIDKNQAPNLHMKADALEWFKTPNKISVKTLSIITQKTSGQIADNYTDMFTIDHID